MMINYCHVNIENLIKVKIKSSYEEDDYDDLVSVRIFEHNKYVTYHFSDADSLDNFLFILEESRIPYDLVDAEGNIIEIEEDLYYEDDLDGEDDDYYYGFD